MEHNNRDYQFNPYSKEEISQIEHDTMLNNLRYILKTNEGRDLFKYLFKHFGVCELPDQIFTGDILFDYLGFLRAGESFFNIASQADSLTSATILAELKREKYNANKN